MKYPITCITPASKLEYCQKSHGVMKALHNVFGAWHDPDLPSISLATWEAIPLELQAKYPFKKKLSKTEFETFFKEDFHPKQQVIGEAVFYASQEAELSTYWSPKYEDIVVVG